MLTQATRKQKTEANHQFLRYREDALMIRYDTHSKKCFKLRDRYNRAVNARLTTLFSQLNVVRQLCAII